MKSLRKRWNYFYLIISLRFRHEIFFLNSPSMYTLFDTYRWRITSVELSFFRSSSYHLSLLLWLISTEVKIPCNNWNGLTNSENNSTAILIFGKTTVNDISIFLNFSILNHLEWVDRSLGRINYLNFIWKVTDDLWEIMNLFLQIL